MENLEITKLFNSVYKGKTVLVTGDTGFKGTWLCYWLIKMGANVIGYSIDDITKPSHNRLLKLKYESYRGDICNTKKLCDVIRKHKPQIVFHLAAQSLVRESYRAPIETYQTNVVGTLSLFEAIKIAGFVKAIVNVTTDKVYENLETNRAYKELDRLGGYDLYSSSKACVEILSESYKRSFFSDNNVLLATARAGNVIGGGDWAKDRLIPDLVKAIKSGKTTIIRSPESIRPWQHVLEPLSGYLSLGQKLLEGKKEFSGAWNFGPDKNQCVTVGEVLKLFRQNWSKLKIEFSKPDNSKFHEAGILLLDYCKAKTKLKWSPVWRLDFTVASTANWYKCYYNKKKLNTEQDLIQYIKDARRNKISWTK
jgi:CDP-glucose 4,6-dehydratase